MTRNISNFEANKLISAGAKVIDIRDKKDFGVSHIPGSINIDIEDLSSLKLNKYSTIIVTCYSGVSSVAAAEYLSELGYKNVLNLKNGYDEYKNHYNVTNRKTKKK